MENLPNQTSGHLGILPCSLVFRVLATDIDSRHHVTSSPRHRWQEWNSQILLEFNVSGRTKLSAKSTGCEQSTFFFRSVLLLYIFLDLTVCLSNVRKYLGSGIR